MFARRKISAGVLGWVLACVAIASAQTTPQTIYVDASNGGVQNGTITAAFRTIGGAMGLVQADRGDTILVLPGTYAERVTLTAGTLLISEAGANSTFIVGTQNVPADLVTLEKGSTLRGFSIGETGGSAVRVPVNGGAEMSNCVVYSSDAGVRCEVDAQLKCVNNTIYNNLTGLSAGPGATVTAFSNNIVAENTTGVFVGDGASVVASYNGFYNNTTAVIGQFPGDTDFVSNPLFVNAQGLNFHLRDVSNMRDAGDPAAAQNDRDGTRNDVGADGGHFGALDTLAPLVLASTFPISAAGDPPLLVSFDARVSRDDWGIASWEWDFDASDGVSVEGSGASVQVLYSEPGGYLVTLLVTDNSGFQASANYTVRVGNPPDVSIIASQNAGPLPLAVNFSADVRSGDNLSYSWDFDGDGVAEAEGASPQYTYPVGTAPGAYNVTLTATDGDGVVTQVQKPITVTEFPVSASASLGAGNTAKITIDDANSPINGAIVTVPTNAVSRAVTVAVGDLSPSDLALQPSGQILELISVSPSRLTLSRPVHVQVPLPASVTDFTGLKVVYYDPSSQAWFDSGITALRISDTLPRTVSFETAHFTTFAVTLPGSSTPTKQMSCAAGGARGGGSGDAVLVGVLFALLSAHAYRNRKVAALSRLR